MTINTADAVVAKVKYLSPPKDGARAYQTINANPATGERDRNVFWDQHDVAIENIRGREHLYNLDNAGFQFFNRPCTKINFRDDKQVEEIYYPESIELIKELTGASRVVLFDHSSLSFRHPFFRQMLIVYLSSSPSPSTWRDRRFATKATTRLPSTCRPDDGILNCPSPSASPT